MTPRRRSERQRRNSIVVSRMMEKMTRMVATARMVGEICSRIPFHICSGIVFWSKEATNKTTTTSSKDVTKAKECA